MTVMLFDHARIAMAQLSRNHSERHIAHGEPTGIGMAEAVEIHGRIDPRGLAGRSIGDRQYFQYVTEEGGYRCRRRVPSLEINDRG